MLSRCVLSPVASCFLFIAAQMYACTRGIWMAGGFQYSKIVSPCSIEKSSTPRRPNKTLEKRNGAHPASPEDIKKVQLKHGKPKRGRTLEYAPAGSGPSLYLINILSDISTPRQSKGVSRTTDPSPSPSASYSFTEENSISLDTHHICLPRARLSSLKERPEQLLQLISNCAAQGIQGMDCS
jgi:hypothetical protein